MNSFEMNKFIGALLATVFIVFSLSLVSQAIWASPPPETPGYEIAAAEPAAGGNEPAAPTEEPIAARLQTADAAAGQALFSRCSACHTDDQSGANKIGPNLWNVVNRPIASHEGFSYSAAMREFSEGGAVVWDYEHLDHFIAAPKGLVRGTAMSFAGLKNPADRANLIAYLRTTADSPAPLPEAPVAGADAGDAAAPAEGAEPAAEGAAPAAGEAAPAEGASPATEGAAPAGAAGSGDEAAPAAGQSGTEPAGANPPAGTAEPAQTESSPATAPATDGGSVGQATTNEPTPAAPAGTQAPIGGAPTANDPNGSGQNQPGDPTTQPAQGSTAPVTSP